MNKVGQILCGQTTKNAIFLSFYAAKRKLEAKVKIKLIQQNYFLSFICIINNKTIVAWVSIRNKF